MHVIFISYRREDSADITGRIYDRLEGKFGRESVFIDVDSMRPGVDFRQHLTNAVTKCDVLLAVIGRNWLNVEDRHGNRRIDNPNDFVRVEIAAALQRNIQIVPVLVGGASMPPASELPGELKLLAYRQAVEIHSGQSFNSQVERLIQSLDILIAQELEVVFPEMVHQDVYPGPVGEGGDPIGNPIEYKSVEYLTLIPLLLSAIQEQQAEIDALKSALQSSGIEVNR